MTETKERARTSVPIVGLAPSLPARTAARAVGLRRRVGRIALATLLVGALQVAAAPIASFLADKALVTSQAMFAGVGFLSSGQHCRCFEISPAVSGKTFWDLDVDGPLVFSTAGSRTLTPTAGFAGTVRMWGGGRGGAGANNGGTSTLSSAAGSTTFAGLTAGGANHGSQVFTGGTASGGDTNENGGAGGTPGFSVTNGGNGGNSPNGGGGGGGGNIQTSGQAGSAPGGGGGGGGGEGVSNPPVGGGAGARVVKTYAPGDLTAGVPRTITVGAGSAGAGGSWSSGGAGAVGRFRIE